MTESIHCTGALISLFLYRTFYARFDDTSIDLHKLVVRLILIRPHFAESKAFLLKANHIEASQIKQANEKERGKRWRELVFNGCCR